jgi:hypothetical protein
VRLERRLGRLTARNNGMGLVCVLELEERAVEDEGDLLCGILSLHSSAHKKPSEVGAMAPSAPTIKWPEDKEHEDPECFTWHLFQNALWNENP